MKKNTGTISEAKVDKAVEAIYKKYDSDGNGVLDQMQIRTLLQDVFRKLGKHVQATSKQVNTFFNAIDSNHDGSISKKQMAQALKRLICIL